MYKAPRRILWLVPLIFAIHHLPICSPMVAYISSHPLSIPPIIPTQSEQRKPIHPHIQSLTKQISCVCYSVSIKHNLCINICRLLLQKDRQESKAQKKTKTKSRLLPGITAPARRPNLMAYEAKKSKKKHTKSQ